VRLAGGRISVEIGITRPQPTAFA